MINCIQFNRTQNQNCLKIYFFLKIVFAFFYATFDIVSFYLIIVSSTLCKKAFYDCCVPIDMTLASTILYIDITSSILYPYYLLDSTPNRLQVIRDMKCQCSRLENEGIHRPIAASRISSKLLVGYIYNPQRTDQFK